jgi:hypothetical protein
MKLVRSLSLLVLFAVTPTLPTRSTARPVDKAQAPEKKEIVECRVSLDIGSDENLRLDLRITERKLIKKLLENPLSKARPDPKPSAYKIRGSVILKYKDGSEVRFVFFQPWGRYKVRDKYMIADFSGIQKAFKKAIANVKEYDLLD